MQISMMLYEVMPVAIAAKIISDSAFCRAS